MNTKRSYSIKEGDRVIHKGKECEVATVLQDLDKNLVMEVSVHRIHLGKVLRNTSTFIGTDWEKTVHAQRAT